MLSWNFAMLLLWTVTSCQEQTWTRGRVELGDSAFHLLKETTRYDPNNPFDLDIIRVNSIQADRLKKCELLIAIGSHITCTNVNSSYVETGDRNISGYVDEHATNARYRGIAGFVQLPDGEVLISDQANRCIHKLNRYTQSVSTFRCDNKNLTGYVPWETFNKPSTMQYDDVTNTVYLLDTKDGRSVIVGLELDTNRTFIAEPKPMEGEVIQDFTYDQPTCSFATVEDSLLVNFTSSGENSTHRFLRSHSAIASYDDIYVLTDGAGYVAMYDTGINCMLFNVCIHINSVSCNLFNATAVAVIDGHLFAGLSSREADEDGLFSANVLEFIFNTISGNSTSTPEFCWTNATTTAKTDAKNSGLSLETTLGIIGCAFTFVGTVWTLMELPCIKKRLKKCKGEPGELIPAENLRAIFLLGSAVGFPVSAYEQADDDSSPGQLPPPGTNTDLQAIATVCGVV